eukprot:COSAG02_NODE_78406_length_117_cov_758.722222_1_plen_28_part_01
MSRRYPPHVKIEMFLTFINFYATVPTMN